jgi:hypothetical protein
MQMQLKKQITVCEIRSSTLINDSAKKWAVDNLEYLNKPMTFFGSSKKVEKGADKFNTYVMYLQPADKVATKTLCAMADAAGCKKPCLISSGQLGMSVGQNAATKRTVLMLLRHGYFVSSILREIDKAERKALRDNIPALFRLNGTSDLNFTYIIDQRPQSQFYDYSKNLSHVKRSRPNYDVTFSGSMYSTKSRAALRKAIAQKHRIAMAWNTKNLKSDLIATDSSFKSFDDTDLRHLDENVIGTLTRKGSSIKERNIENMKNDSFFITAANIEAFKSMVA